MFETLVTGLLTNALGSYIDPKCFSGDKISVAVWEGYVVLHDLEVKPEVFADLPALRLVRGVVGSIELKIPRWNRLHSESVVATIDDVYLLVQTEEDLDAVMMAMDEFTLKKRLLDDLYKQAKRQEEQEHDAAAGEDGFAARLINKIIDNLELHIRMIHVRVEDQSSGDHPFALGLTIESVHAQSTNSNWQPSYVDAYKSNEPRIFKIVELNHLSVYLNPDCELVRDRSIDFEVCSLDNFSNTFHRAIPKRFDRHHFQHHFLLKPIDASARLIVNRDVFDASVPTFEVDVNIPDVAFRLEESQYCDLLYLASALQVPDHYAKYQRYRKIRPQSTAFDEPVLWWQYAIKAVVEDAKESRQRWTWAYMKDRREDRKRYVSLWQQKSIQLLELTDMDYIISDSEENGDERIGDASGDSGDAASQDGERESVASSTGYSNLLKSLPELDSALEEIERRRTVEDVLFFRYLADQNLRKRQASRAPRRKLPTPPMHHPREFSDSESVDTEMSEPSVPSEVQYRSWGAWMFGWTSKLTNPAADGEHGETPRRVIPDVELRELFKILEYEPAKRSKKRLHQQKHRNRNGKEDGSGFDGEQSQGEVNELYRISVTLQRGSLTLASDPETNRALLRDDPSYGHKYSPTDFLLGTFSQLQVAAVARDDTVVVDVSLQSIEAFDESAESSSFSRLLSRKQTIRPGAEGDDANVSKLSGVVFLMNFEMNPANSRADASLVVHMEPLEIVLSPTARCWGRLAQFMDTPATLGLWAELEVASFNDIVNLKARTEAKLDYVMENRIALSVVLNIQAPVIIIPESDTDYNCARLVVDLGRINFRTDRLSQLDSDTVNFSSSNSASMGRSGMGSLALMSPPHARNMNPNTSFVQQLYDEAEKGEGAIRWKEEFYDKFSLSVANVHVLLIPRGKTIRGQEDGLASSGRSYPSVSLPPYLLDMYDEEQEFELVERFNINVTVRTSILPLDATLTRLYVHADLPALTFNLSIEKYFQLVTLMDRFSVAAAKAPQSSRKAPDTAFYSTEDAFEVTAVGAVDPDDQYEAMRRASFLSTSALKKFMLDDNEGGALSAATEGENNDEGDSDGNSSVESDDTWFSITSGNADMNLSSLDSDDIDDAELSISDLTGPGSSRGGSSMSPPPRSVKKAKKRARLFTSGQTTKLLDRKLFVCSFTVPVISIQLKKPRSTAVSSYASYRYDTSDFDDDPADSGTVLVKLQGFRIRVGQKSLSTQVNVSLVSLEVEDFLDSSGRSTQFLLFSCPTIAAPFSMKAPLRRGAKFPSYPSFRRRSNQQRERVISFQRIGPTSGGAPGSRGAPAPETLLEVVFSSLSDQKSGKEVLRDVDVQIGSVQFNFDQSYVCSLLELFEESSSQVALVPPSARSGTAGGAFVSDSLDGSPPPFELTPSIDQEYSMPVSLTESVRADLERARKNFFKSDPKPEAANNESEDAAANRPLPVMLKLGARLHSLSICFSDRGESVASVAILHSQLQLGTAQAGQVNATGLVGDIKVFDLASKKSQNDGLGIAGAAGRGPEASMMDFIEIFGLDTSSLLSHSGSSQNMVSVDCSVFKDGGVKTRDDVGEEGDANEKRSKSRLSLSVQPVRLLAQPEFVGIVASYALDGPLRAHFLSKGAVAIYDDVATPPRTTRTAREPRPKSFDSEFQLASSTSPLAPRTLDFRPESSTPFFDAVDSTSRRSNTSISSASPAADMKSKREGSDREGANHDEAHAGVSADGPEFDAVLASVLDKFDLDVTLFHPSILFPSTSLKDMHVSLHSQPCSGINVDFGAISVTLQSQSCPDPLAELNCSSREVMLDVKDLQITSVADQTAILDRSGLLVRCMLPTPWVGVEHSLSKSGEDKPAVSLSVEIHPICFNISETNVCVALDVFYDTISPISDTIQDALRQVEIDEGVSVFDSASASDGETKDRDDARMLLAVPATDTADWGRVAVSFVLEEFRVAFVSYSEAPHQFETWMKSIIDLPDEISSRDSSGNSVQQSSPRRQRYFSQHFMGRRGSFPNELPCCVIGEVSLVALEAKLTMDLTAAIAGGEATPLECDFSLREAVIRDKIADQSEYLTHLFGPVPGAVVDNLDPRASFSSERSSFMLFSQDSMPPPLLRTSTSQSAKLNVDSSQLSGRLVVKQIMPPGDGSGHAVTTYSLDVTVSSARLILLPRTLLRLEHFALDVFLAATKKTNELESSRDEDAVNNPPGVGGSGYTDERANVNDDQGDHQETRFGVPPLRSRKDSISESLKDELNVVRTAFMSPLQRMLSTASAKDGRAPGSYTSRAIAEESGDGASNSSGSKAAAGEDGVDTRKKLLVPQWEVDARLLNLELWVVSTDRKADVTGCVLSSQLAAKFDSTINGAGASGSLDQNELVAAIAKLSRVVVRIDSPMADGSRAAIPESPSKPGYSSGTLVESFDVDLRLHLRQCYRSVPVETIDPESSEENSIEKIEESTAAVTCIDTSAPGCNDDAVDSPKLFLRDIPSEWEEWILHEPSVRVDKIASHVAYRDLPQLLKISASMTSVLNAEQNVRNTFLERLKAASDGVWSEFPDTSGDYSGYAHYFDTDEMDDGKPPEYALPVNEHDVLTRASLHMDGVKFRLMNNIVDQESPVIDFDAGTIKILLRAETNSMVEIDARCTVEARYQNLRLVTMEPLIEPWSVGVTLSQRQLPRPAGSAEAESQGSSPWKLKISSDVFLDVNLTDAFIANMMAANRAWKWVVNAGGDSRETTEYSTYWIRNNTGLPLRYWGASYNAQSLAPGQEEPLRFNNVPTGSGGKNNGEKSEQSSSRDRAQRNTHVRDRQLFIAVEEEYSSDSLSNAKRKWQSETPIPVDQVDSRMYALVDFEADLSSTRMRKCECVIDVLVEHGCKYFVVRSTLLLENQTASDLEVEFVPPQRRASSSRSLRPGGASSPGHVIPIWKKVVKASSVLPVPVHLVSSGEGYVNVRPPEMNGADSGNEDGGYLPKAYAKERVPLPVFDRGTPSASEEITHAEMDDSGRTQCTVKFRRLYSDRPVRPFMMTACLSSASSALYHRTLSFHPSLIVHNLTAGPLDFCLNTPNDWTPAVDAVSLTNAGISSGWETREQRLRERGTIAVADSLIWHLSSDETPLELSVRMKGFEWSEPLELEDDLGDLVRIKMKDLVSDAHLFITAEIHVGKGGCRELFLYVPYWIVNLTGLKLEFEYDEERAGPEHPTMLLAGQKRLDRDELLLKENQRAKAAQRERNPHLLHVAASEDQDTRNGSSDGARAGSNRPRERSPDRRDNGRKRRHPRLLPSVPPVKGLLDLIPESIDTSRSLGQLEVLQACHSDYRMDRGCVRLRVSEGSQTAPVDARKESGQRKWSDSFVLDQAGTIGEIEADDDDANRKYSIGYSITPAKGQYSRTKVIMLTPRFMLINTMSSAIEVCHSSAKMVTPSPMDMSSAAAGHIQNSRVISPANPVVQLDAGAFADFHWTLRFAKSRTIRCRLAEFGWSWSGAVPLAESGEYAVRMRHESTRESKLMRVTLKLDASCVCVYFREERTTAPPYRVENYSLETLRIHQHRVRRSEILLPHHSLDYAWDEPTEVRTLVVDMLPSAAGDNSRPLRISTFELDKIGQYPDALGGTLGIEISTDGPTRVLRFTDTRLRGDKVASTSTPASSDPTTSAQETDRGGSLFLRRFVTAPTLHATLHLQGIGISIVDGVPKELLYVSVSGVSLEVLMSEEDQENNAAAIAGSSAALSRLERETRPRIMACRLQVGDVQVDNQLQMTPYPVLLRFSNPNGRSRIVDGQAVHIPVLELSLVKHDEYAGIHFIRHFSVSVLPVHIRVDGSLLYQMLPLLVHSNMYGGSSGGGSARDKKRTVVLVNGGGDSDASRAAHSHLLLEDFNASLEVTVKVLEAAQKDGTTSAGRSSAPTTPSIRVVSRRGSNQAQQQPMQQNQHTGLATEIQRYTVAKHGSMCAIASNEEEKKLYFEEFYIDPIRATVSFSFGDSAGAIVDGHLASLSHAAAAESSSVTVGPLRLILNAIGTSLTKIANAPFQLKALEIHNSFVQPDALATRLASHYQSEALRQAYVILGSVDVLGNPMIAWKNMRSGFADFVAEPAHGLTQRSPRAFAFGMGRGTLSLVRASVYTFLDFNTRILTAFSLGLSEACLKLDDYTGYPATRHIFQGLVQGVSGVVVAPIHSFELNGARGVFPGLVAGAFGVVLKPLLGFSLATATTAATLRDAVDPTTKALLVRARPPRHIDLRTKRLKVYSYVESLGEEIVGKIRGGRYRADGYLGHLDLNRQCFLVTRRRILLLDVRGTQTATKYEVVWELLAEEIVMVDCSRTPKEQVVTIYYMEDEFRGASGAGNGANSGASGGASGNGTNTRRRRTPGVPRGMFLQKHVVALPDTKVLFVRAMLQQQERSLLTKMNSYTAGEAGTPHRSHHPSPMPSVTRATSMELSTSWQQTHQRMPTEYPVFRLPPTLHTVRSFANLKQTPPPHQE